MSVSTPGAMGQTKGGFWVRFVALLIDGLILFIPFAILAAIFGAFNRTDSGGFSGVLVILYGLLLIANIAYFLYFWTSGGGQTVGMKALHLRVVKTDGSPLSMGSAILRYVIMTFVNSIIFGIPLGYIWAAFDSEKQGWHDKVAGTYVVKV